MNSAKKIELERCPICGCSVCALQNELPLKERWYIWCVECDLQFGWEPGYGGIYDTEEELAREWNSGEAFRYRKMWERLSEDLAGVKARINSTVLTKKDLVDHLIAYMEFIEEEAERGGGKWRITR